MYVKNFGILFIGYEISFTYHALLFKESVLSYRWVDIQTH